MRISDWSSDVCASDRRMLFYPAELADMAGDAARACDVEGSAYEDFLALQPHQSPLPQARTDDICYMQYSSASTRFPHGVAVTHHELLNNRSDEHTSELQSLMHISYDVFCLKQNNAKETQT